MSPEDRWYTPVGLNALTLLLKGMTRGLRYMTDQHQRAATRTLRSTHPMMTLNEPNGVTNIGGAKEYAAKFATGGREGGYEEYGVIKGS
jgi:hypothetical protein